MKSKIKSLLTDLSKSEFLRKHSDFFQNWYSGHVLNDEVKKAITLGKLVGYYRSLLFWRYAPRKYVGGALLNLLGLQLIRYYFYNLRYLMRGRLGVTASQIASRGIVIERSFLPHETIVRLLKFYSDNRDKSSHHFRDFSELVIVNSNGVAQNGRDFAELYEHLLKDCGILRLGEDLTGLALRLSPFVSILHYKSYIDQRGQSDGQDTPHSDVFYPSFKLFVYLNEVNESNGAFRYLQYSNQFSVKGAINAYKDSLRHYFGGGKSSLYPTDASIGLGGDELSWLSASGRPGDGVIFNVQGIHRRGDFLKDQFRERLVLLVDFRQVEVPIQRLAANV